jgi:hypothetical protein
MRRIVSILFLSLMLLQAIPVLHFFSSQKEVFYTYIDEEKPVEKLTKEKKDAKEYITLLVEAFVEQPANKTYSTAAERSYSSPILTLTTPPPDIC